jgi:succinate dehydrogenase / fumarate reductase, flavoprotein subunit
MLFHYDVVIIGSGMAGLRAAIETSTSGYSTAVITKSLPTRAHSVVAQGGISAPLGNATDDSWETHMYDTVKGSDYLGDQDAIEVMTRDAARTVYELEHMGVPFSRLETKRIAQRPFGGHTNPRACYAADRTGHVIMQTLYEQCIRQKVKFYSEHFVTSLILEDNISRGVVAYDIKEGEVDTLHSKAVLLATGGALMNYKFTSNGFANTGDGLALTYSKGVPLEDMEFIQFHPTGLYPLGILITEGVRGEGGILLNDKGERFMEEYAPQMKDLASRDVISRAMYTEIKEGRGIGGKDHLHLQISHIGKDAIMEKLPDMYKFAMTYVGVDCTKEPFPVKPTAHYMMGGIPTDKDGRVLLDNKNNFITGLYAAGECACASVHGANRLGCNSLLDAVVFGRRAGKDIMRFVEDIDYPALPDDTDYESQKTIEKILSSTGKEHIGNIRKDLQGVMEEKCSVFRTEELLKECLYDIRDLQDRYQEAFIVDKGKLFNTDLILALELGNMLEYSEVIAFSALERKESRGAHSRVDYPNRDDENFLKHTLVHKTPEGPKLSHKNVTITKHKPAKREY